MFNGSRIPNTSRRIILEDNIVLAPLQSGVNGESITVPEGFVAAAARIYNELSTIVTVKLPGYKDL